MRSLLLTCLLVPAALASPSVSLIGHFPSELSDAATVQVRDSGYVIGGCAELEYLLLWGGFTVCTDVVQSVWRVSLDDTEVAPEALAPLPATLHRHSATHVDGKIYVFGGHGYAEWSRDVHVYTIDTNSWSTLQGVYQLPKIDLGSFALDGVIYLVGGYDEAFNVYDTVTAFDTNTMSFLDNSAVPNLQQARGGHSVVQHTDGTVVVLGGFDPTFTTTNLVEVYHPSSAQWTTLTIPETAVGDTIVTVLPDDTIVFLGGEPGSIQARATGISISKDLQTVQQLGKDGSFLPQAMFRAAAFSVGQTSLVVIGGEMEVDYSCDIPCARLLDTMYLVQLGQAPNGTPSPTTVTLAPTLSPTASPTASPTHTPLDVHFVLDKSASMTKFGHCESASGEDCWSTAVTFAETLGYEFASSLDGLSPNLRVSLSAFSCTGQQHFPLSFEYGSGMIDSSDSFDSAIAALKEATIPRRAGSCATHTLDRTAVQIEQATLETPNRVSIVVLVTDAQIYDKDLAIEKARIIREVLGAHVFAVSVRPVLTTRAANRLAKYTGSLDHVFKLTDVSSAADLMNMAIAYQQGNVASQATGVNCNFGLRRYSLPAGLVQEVSSRQGSQLVMNSAGLFQSVCEDEHHAASCMWNTRKNKCVERTTIDL